MYNPNDPQRMYGDPNTAGTSFSFPCAAITDPSQAPQGPRPEGNVAYQPAPFALSLTGPLSASNSTTEHSNTQQQGASFFTYKPGDAPAGSAPVPASAAVQFINLMYTRPTPSSPVFVGQRLPAASQAPSFALFPATQTVFSHPNTPLRETQLPQVYQAPCLISTLPQPQTFTTSAAVPTTGTPPATPQHLVFRSGNAPSATFTSLSLLKPAAAAPATVVGGGGSAAHLPTSALSPAMTYQQPTQLTHPSHGTGTFLVDAAPLLSAPMPPSYMGVASPSWADATPMYSTASAAALGPREPPSLASAAAAAVTASATAGSSASQQRLVPTARSTSGRNTTSVRSEARPAPISALVHRPPTAAHVAGASTTTTTTTAAAAGGSPEGIQPAALGVRNFSAPDPVGSCLLPNLPLDPIIPPLALPCPRWGKLPHTAGNANVRVTR